eukprot:gi/632967208/ref/XP_007899848.1/ PREDICTED: selenoprotein P-like [Callorhinchus milii]
MSNDCQDGGRLDSLRKNLTNAGLVNISYLIVNHQEKLSRDLYQNFTDLVSRDIPVYQQNVHQPNIWKLLQGVTDDFLIYDRCGHLTYHLGLPYTLLTLPYVETAIRMTYCQNICSGCSVMQYVEACNSTSATEENTADKTVQNHRRGVVKSVNKADAQPDSGLNTHTQLLLNMTGPGEEQDPHRRRQHRHHQRHHKNHHNNSGHREESMAGTSDGPTANSPRVQRNQHSLQIRP